MLQKNITWAAESKRQVPLARPPAQRQRFAYKPPAPRHREQSRARARPLAVHHSHSTATCESGAPEQGSTICRAASCKQQGFHWHISRKAVSIALLKFGSRLLGSGSRDSGAAFLPSPCCKSSSSAPRSAPEQLCLRHLGLYSTPGGAAAGAEPCWDGPRGWDRRTEGGPRCRAHAGSTGSGTPSIHPSEALQQFAELGMLLIIQQC